MKSNAGFALMEDSEDPSPQNLTPNQRSVLSSRGDSFWDLPAALSDWRFPLSTVGVVTFIAFVLGCVGTGKGNANEEAIADLQQQLAKLKKHVNKDCPHGDMLFGEELLESPDGDSFYQIVGVNGAELTWMDAYRDAQSRCKGGHRGYLAIIGSAAENALLHGYLTNTPSTGYVEGDMAWIGATDTQVEGDFAWVGPQKAMAGVVFWTGGQDGAPVKGAYTNWGKNEPNSGGHSGKDEDCVAMHGNGVYNDPGSWNDENCYLPKAYFIVEFGPPPESVKREWAASHDDALDDDVFK